MLLIGIAIHASRGRGLPRLRDWVVRRFLAPRMNGQFTIFLQISEAAGSHLKP
jgi:hypothetical protein